jgi:hypothetical protein
MTEQNKLKIQVILGSTRKGRFSDKPGKWILEEAQKKEGVEAELVDLRDYPLPFFDEPMGPAGLQGKYSSDIAVQWAKKVAEADAYIIAQLLNIITAIPPSLKMPWITPITSGTTSQSGL